MKKTKNIKELIEMEQETKMIEEIWKKHQR